MKMSYFFIVAIIKGVATRYYDFHREEFCSQKCKNFTYVYMCESKCLVIENQIFLLVFLAFLTFFLQVLLAFLGTLRSGVGVPVGPCFLVFVKLKFFPVKIEMSGFCKSAFACRLSCNIGDFSCAVSNFYRRFFGLCFYRLSYLVL